MSNRVFGAAASLHIGQHKLIAAEPISRKVKIWWERKGMSKLKGSP